MDGTPLGMMFRVYSGVAALAYLWADAPDALGRELHPAFSLLDQAGLFEHLGELGLNVRWHREGHRIDIGEDSSTRS